MSWEDYKVNYRKRNGLLIGVNGVARSGKDTIGQYLVDNYGFKKLSFAEALRKGLYDINPIIYHTVEFATAYKFLSGNIGVIKAVRLKDIIDDEGWEVAKVKYPEVRELMQRYGTEGGRDIHGPDCWTSIL